MPKDDSYTATTDTTHGVESLRKRPRQSVIDGSIVLSENKTAQPDIDR